MRDLILGRQNDLPRDIIAALPRWFDAVWQLFALTVYASTSVFEDADFETYAPYSGAAYSLRSRVQYSGKVSALKSRP